MHADAAVGAGVVFDPTGVESVVGFEFAPVRHRGSLEQPSGGFLAQQCLPDVAAVVRVAVGIGAFFLDLVEDAEVATWSGAAGCPDGNGHGKEAIGALHDISALFAKRNLHFHIVWIFRKFRRPIIGMISGKPADAGTGAGWDKRCGDDGGNECVNVFEVHNSGGFNETLSFEQRNASQSIDEFFHDEGMRLVVFFLQKICPKILH